jgi:hypothetical protein
MPNRSSSRHPKSLGNAQLSCAFSPQIRPLDSAKTLFFETNLRIPPDLSPVSIRLALLFLLLRAWRMERKKKRPTRPKSRALFQQHRPKAEVAEARHLANAHILGIRHAVVDVIAGLRRGEAES